MRGLFLFFSRCVILKKNLQWIYWQGIKISLSIFCLWIPQSYKSQFLATKISSFFKQQPWACASLWSVLASVSPLKNSARVCCSYKVRLPLVRKFASCFGATGGSGPPLSEWQPCSMSRGMPRAITFGHFSSSLPVWNLCSAGEPGQGWVRISTTGGLEFLPYKWVWEEEGRSDLSAASAWQRVWE